MIPLVDEEGAFKIAGILVPELASRFPDADPMGAASAVLLEASQSGDGQLCARVAQLAAMFWDYGDEDVRADVVAGFFCGLKDMLGSMAPNDLLLASLTPDQRTQLKETQGLTAP